MKLYVFPPSPNARKPMFVAHHLGLEHDTEIVDLSSSAQHAADYAKLNPNEMMPTLVDGDFVLWESNAISQYLCSKSASQTLFPSDPKSQADVNRWQCWELAHWAPACGSLVFENMVKALFGDTSGPDPEKVKAGEQQVHKYAAVLNQSLAGRQWLVGDEVTLADISTGVFVTFAAPARLPLDGYAEIQRWYSQLEEIDAFKATLPQMPALE